MGKTEQEKIQDARLRAAVAQARAKVLRDSLKAFDSDYKSRVQADRDAKAEIREMLSRYAPQALALQLAMVLDGSFDFDGELFQALDRIIDRAIGKAAQPLTGGDGGPIQTQQIPFDPRAISLEQAEAAKNAIEEAKRILGVSGK